MQRCCEDSGWWREGGCCLRRATGDWPVALLWQSRGCLAVDSATAPAMQGGGRGGLCSRARRPPAARSADDALAAHEPLPLLMQLVMVA